MAGKRIVKWRAGADINEISIPIKISKKKIYNKVMKSLKKLTQWQYQLAKSTFVTYAAPRVAYGQERNEGVMAEESSYRRTMKYRKRSSIEETSYIGS